MQIFWEAAALTESGFTRRHTQIASANVLSDFLRKNFPDATYHTVYESGFSGYSTFYELEPFGINCVMAHAADVPTSQYELNVNTTNVYLYKLAEHYDIAYEQCGISVRGHIYWAEFDDDEDGGLLSFDTESAWTACNQFFEELNKALGGELSISYREIECGCDIFFVQDEGDFFSEECCVSSSGGRFEDVCEDVYSTIQDAINE